MSKLVTIRQLPSGVRGLDEVLGGGIPEFSFNLIAGGPGTGKTTLGHQILFSTAGNGRKALFISVLGEPPIKMLRYQQQFSFFDPTKVDEHVRFVYLGQEALESGLERVLESIKREVETFEPGVVVVDSFRAVVRRALSRAEGESELQSFVQRLALHLTSCEATTFLLGEYRDGEQDSALFTVADGIIWLTQSVDRNSVVRKVQVVKMRGQGQIPGLHTARIDDDGYQVFPRLSNPEQQEAVVKPLEHRQKIGIAGVDEMLGGGVPQGYSVLVAGPSGSGKTVLTNQFLIEGAKQDQPGILAIFEKRPNDYLHTTPFGPQFERMIAEKRLEILYLRPLDLSIDETLLAMREAIERVGAKRAVIDSLSGLELALAPTFREDFRESLYRMVGTLTGLGVTVMATVELADSFVDLTFSPQGVAFLTDGIIMQRYLQIEGQLRRALSVVKLRGSEHSKDIREYEVTQDGLLVVGEPLRDYHGILTGAPQGPGRRGHDDQTGRPD